MKQLDMVGMGNRIRKLREKKHLSQEALGEKLHVSGKNVSKWELGKGLITTDVLVAMAELFGTDLTWITIGGEMNNTEMERYAKLYEEGTHLEDKVLFNKDGLNQIYFRGCIYDYGENNSYAMYGELTFYLNLEDNALNYPAIFAQGAESITYHDPHDHSIRENFVTFEELMKAEIDRDRSNDDAVVRTFAQGMFFRMWDQIFYNICNFSDEKLEKICFEDVQDVGFDYPDWAIWTTIDTALELLERLFERHKDAIVRTVKMNR